MNRWVSMLLWSALSTPSHTALAQSPAPQKQAPGPERWEIGAEVGGASGHAVEDHTIEDDIAWNTEGWDETRIVRATAGVEETLFLLYRLSPLWSVGPAIGAWQFVGYDDGVAHVLDFGALAVLHARSCEGGCYRGTFSFRGIWESLPAPNGFEIQNNMSGAFGVELSAGLGLENQYGGHRNSFDLRLVIHEAGHHELTMTDRRTGERAEESISAMRWCLVAAGGLGWFFGS